MTQHRSQVVQSGATEAKLISTDDDLRNMKWFKRKKNLNLTKAQACLNSSLQHHFIKAIQLHVPDADKIKKISTKQF